MSLININPSSIASTLTTTAGARLVSSVTKSMSPKLVRDVQRLFSVSSLVGNALGARTGVGAIDNLLGLSGGENAPSTLLGGLSPRQARQIYDQINAARVARKNLFFVRIEDRNSPIRNYSQPTPLGGGGGLGGMVMSQIGPAISEVSYGISKGINSISQSLGGSVLASVLGGDGNALGEIATNTLDLLAMDVSYNPSLVADHQQIGSTFIDKPTGMAPLEFSITTMDDEAGSLKSWFDGKLKQVAHPDGTVGLPYEYEVRIDVVHAVPSASVDGWRGAYIKSVMLRPSSYQVDLSRREQGVAELQMQFTQFDPFMKAV